MGIKLLTTIAAIGAFPAVALAQQATTPPASPKPTSTAPASAPETVTRTTSSGAVIGTTTVTEAMHKAQQDPNLIGSPAWWSNHSTADGKPKH